MRSRSEPSRPSKRSHRAGGADERGFTLIEVILAMTVLAVCAAAFATTSSQGLRLIGTSMERQTAVQVGNRWMEEARAVPYAGLALDSATVFAGAGTPDSSVTGGTYAGAAGTETLVTSSGGLAHNATAGPNNMYGVYRYVTWVADGAAAQAYKRVTVVLQWKGGGTGSAPATVSLSTIVAPRDVAWAGTTTTTTPASTTTTVPTTTTTVATTTTTAASCANDHTAPTGSITILAGTGANTGYTSSSTVSLSLNASDPCPPLTMAFSNDNVTYSTPVAYATSQVWALTPGDGNRTVWVHYMDGVGNTSVASATIRVDGTPPSIPGSFTATASGHSQVVLTWTASTDNDTLIGYRIYVKPSGGSFQSQPTGVTAPCGSNPCTWTHSGLHRHDVYTYYVVAYDAAGNESAQTAQITVTL